METIEERLEKRSQETDKYARTGVGFWKEEELTNKKVDKNNCKLGNMDETLNQITNDFALMADSLNEFRKMTGEVGKGERYVQYRTFRKNSKNVQHLIQDLRAKVLDAFKEEKNKKVD